MNQPYLPIDDSYLLDEMSEDSDATARKLDNFVGAGPGAEGDATTSTDTVSPDTNVLLPGNSENDPTQHVTLGDRLLGVDPDRVAVVPPQIRTEPCSTSTCRTHGTQPHRLTYRSVVTVCILTLVNLLNYMDRFTVAG